MGTDVKVKTHHQKFFDNLRIKAEQQEAVLAAPRLAMKDQAALALKAAKGNKTRAARLLGWSRNKINWWLSV